MLEPLTAGLIFVVAGAAGAGTYGAYDFVKKVGPQLEPGDLLPMPPPYPPFPRFMYTKPKVLESLRR